MYVVCVCARACVREHVSLFVSCNTQTVRCSFHTWLFVATTFRHEIGCHILDPNRHGGLMSQDSAHTSVYGYVLENAVCEGEERSVKDVTLTWITVAGLPSSRFRLEGRPRPRGFCTTRVLLRSHNTAPSTSELLLELLQSCPSWTEATEVAAACLHRPIPWSMKPFPSAFWSRCLYPILAFFLKKWWRKKKVQQSNMLRYSRNFAWIHSFQHQTKIESVSRRFLIAFVLGFFLFLFSDCTTTARTYDVITSYMPSMHHVCVTTMNGIQKGKAKHLLCVLISSTGSRFCLNWRYDFILSPCTYV